MFKDKTLMITGGTGSFGNAVLNRFISGDIGEIRIFSRDEKKQDDMRHDFQARMPQYADKLKFYIGDVRDIQSVKKRHARRGLHLPCGGAQAGAFMRVFPAGGRKDQCVRHGQRAHRRDRRGA